MEDLRIAIIGAGRLASLRIYPYIGAAGAVIAGVCDLDGEKAERNATRFGGRAFTDYDEMLEQVKPDAVFVCIGPEYHAKLAIEMMRRGIPVYTEKPPAPTAAEALKVAEVSRETGVLCSTAFKKRYNVAYNRAKNWLAEFPSEQRLSISVDYASGRYANTSPRTDFLLDFAIHMIDVTAYLYGEVAEVFSYAKGPEAYAVSVKFIDGSIGSLNFNHGRSFSLPTEEVEITLSDGNFMSIHNSSIWKISEGGKGSEWREPSTFVSGGDSGNDTGHLAEIVDFLAAVREGRTTRSNIFESYKSMLFYEAIRDSARLGTAQKLDYMAWE